MNVSKAKKRRIRGHIYYSTYSMFKILIQSLRPCQLVVSCDFSFRLCWHENTSNVALRFLNEELIPLVRLHDMYVSILIVTRLISLNIYFIKFWNSSLNYKKRCLINWGLTPYGFSSSSIFISCCTESVST